MKRKACGIRSTSGPDRKLFFISATDTLLELLIAICRAGATLLSVPQIKEKSKDVLEATRQAGREPVKAMQIAPETMARITQPLRACRSKIGKVRKTRSDDRYALQSLDIWISSRAKPTGSRCSWNRNTMCREI